MYGEEGGGNLFLTLCFSKLRKKSDETRKLGFLRNDCAICWRKQKTNEKSKMAETQVFWLDFCNKKGLRRVLVHTTPGIKLCTLVLQYWSFSSCVVLVTVSKAKGFNSYPRNCIVQTIHLLESSWLWDEIKFLLYHLNGCHTAYTPAKWRKILKFPSQLRVTAFYLAAAIRREKCSSK